jgi:hypothetical protein
LPTNRDNIKTFGIAPPRTFDPDTKRPYDIEYTLGIEREVASGLSLAATWVRRDTYNLPQTVNRLVDISDFTPFDVPNPLTGETMPLYNLNPAKQGLVDLLDTTADRSIARYGYNGFDVNFRARLARGQTFEGIPPGRRSMSRAVICPIRI